MRSSIWSTRRGLRGIVSKRLGSKYRSGNTTAWLKTKSYTVSDLELLGVERERGKPAFALMGEPGTRKYDVAFQARPDPHRRRLNASFQGLFFEEFEHCLPANDLVGQSRKRPSISRLPEYRGSHRLCKENHSSRTDRLRTATFLPSCRRRGWRLSELMSAQPRRLVSLPLRLYA